MKIKRISEVKRKETELVSGRLKKRRCERSRLGLRRIKHPKELTRWWLDRNLRNGQKTGALWKEI